MFKDRNRLSITAILVFFGLQLFAYIIQIPEGTTEYFRYSMYHEITTYHFEGTIDGVPFSDEDFRDRYRFKKKGRWRAIEHLFAGIQKHEDLYGKGEKIVLKCIYHEDLDKKEWFWSN